MDIATNKDEFRPYHASYLPTGVPCHAVIFTCQATPQKVQYEARFAAKPFSMQYALNIIKIYTIEQSTMETNYGKR